ATRLRMATSGEFRGRRMSGQEVIVPRSRLSSLAMGDRREADVPVGVWDMSALGPAFSAIDGFLSLRFFERRPFTLDYGRKTLVLETDGALAARATAGAAVPIRFDRTDGMLTVFLEMDVGTDRPALLELDTGSDALILNSSYVGALGIDPTAPDVRTTQGTDE